MDNIGELLNSVLSDPSAMEKLRDTAKQFGIDADALIDNAGGEAGVEASSEALREQSAPSTENLNAAGDINVDMLSAITKIAPLLSKLKEEDDMTRLIHALKPYLSGDRRKKAEEADKIMAVMRIIPLLKNTKL